MRVINLVEKNDEDDDDERLTYTGKQGENCQYSGTITCNAHYAALSSSDNNDKGAMLVLFVFVLSC